MRIKRKVIAPTRANLGVEAAYYRRLDRLICEMNRSTLYYVKAAYRANPPENLAMDRSPAAVLSDVIKKLVKRWTARFDDYAKNMATWFANQSMGRGEKSLKANLKKAGIAIEWKLTPAANDAYRAVIAENVGLIKSIPQQYLGQVEGMVMRSVAAGGDLQQLTDDIVGQFGVTRRRAEIIATSQNKLATGVIVKTRMLEAGITHAVWLHSAGGKVPRPSHVKASRERMVYEVAKGAFIDGEFIFPGQLPGCRCVCKPVVEGFT